METPAEVPEVGEMDDILESVRRQALPWLGPKLLEAELEEVSLVYEDGKGRRETHALKFGGGAKKERMMSLSIAACCPDVVGLPVPLEGGRVVYSKILSASEEDRTLELSSSAGGSWGAWFRGSLETEVTPPFARSDDISEEKGPGGFSARLLFGVGLTTDVDDPAANVFHSVDSETEWWAFLVDRLARHVEERRHRKKAILFPGAEVLWRQRRPTQAIQLLGRCRLFYEALLLSCRRSGKPVPTVDTFVVVVSPVDDSESFIHNEDGDQPGKVVFNWDHCVVSEARTEDLLGPPLVEANGYKPAIVTWGGVRGVVVPP